MTRDERRALRLLASEAHGVTEAPMLAHGFRREMLAGLVLAGACRARGRRLGWPSKPPFLGPSVGAFAPYAPPHLQMGPVAPVAWKKLGFLAVRHVTPLVRALPAAVHLI